MEITYGQGAYLDGKSEITGEIRLGDHKLFLKGPAGDWAETFIPLEKVYKIRRVGDCLEVSVRLSLVNGYVVLIKGKKSLMNSLAKEVAVRRGLKKMILRQEWAEKKTSSN